MTRAKLLVALACTGILVTSGQAALAAEAAGATPADRQAAIGQQVQGFTLDDYRGRSRSLDDFADSQLVVLAFLGTECPLVKLYAPRLADLAEEYGSRGVAFVGINSNQQDSIQEISHFARKHEIDFPILKDPGNSIADQLGAMRTPEVFVLDDERRIRYWGRIDDQYTPGIARPAPKQRDLADALDSLLSGEAVAAAVTDAPGCHIGRVQRPQPSGDVTYANQISRVFQAHCLECHREDQVAPFALTSYDEVVGWAEMIREVVEEGRMPPWHADPRHGEFVNDPSLTAEEKDLIYKWVENGCPLGDESQLPPPREFVEGWRIPEPDEVFYMSAAPVTVPAEGTVDYMHLMVDPGFTEDRWIQAAEARPGNAAVVHHIIVFVQEPGQRGGFANPQMGYAPGMPPRQFPEGMAIRIPAGAQLMFQMHYTPIGTPQQDRSYVGFKYADPDTVTHEVVGGASGDVGFRIPPGDDNYKVTSRRKFRRPTHLLSLLPHMHLRGKSFRIELEYPDGEQEVLLDVPNYDFNWQMWYNYADPKPIPKGTLMHCTAYFDNSADNPVNPDPTATVTWGEQTWEEMMFGFYSVVEPREDLPPQAAESGD